MSLFLVVLTGTTVVYNLFKGWDSREDWLPIWAFLPKSSVIFLRPELELHVCVK